MSRSDTDGVDDSAARWEDIGRSLLREQLNGAADETRGTFGEVSSKIARGEEVTKADVDELYAQLEELRFAVERVAETVPGSQRAGLEEYMTRDELEAVEDRVLAENHGGEQAAHAGESQ